MSAPKVTTDEAQRFYRLLEARGTGVANALSARQCAEQLGFTGNKEDSERRVRACRELALRSGLLICSGPRGYHLPDSMAEVEASCARRSSQIKDMAVLINLEFQLAAEHFHQSAPKRGRKAVDRNQMALSFSAGGPA